MEVPNRNGHIVAGFNGKIMNRNISYGSITDIAVVGWHYILAQPFGVKT